MKPLSVRLLTIRLVTASLIIFLAACGGGDNDDDNAGSSTSANRDTSSKYGLYNDCFVMKADGAYVVRGESGYTADGSDAEAAEKFFMRAANLARYLFYTPDEMLLTAAGSQVSLVPLSAASNGSDWTFDEAGKGTLTASTLGGFLAVGPNNTLVLADAPAKLKFEAAQGCAVYPEMPLAVTGKAYKGDVNKPVIGFAEVHAHMGAGDQLSDGTTDLGPAHAGVLYGHAVDRFGVTHALDNCEAIHGPNGILDPEALILDLNPGTTHNTEGWPTFVDWPFHDSQLHQQMYWRWVERAWMSGLRVMTVLGTHIEALCEFGATATPHVGAQYSEVDCKDMSIGLKQVGYLTDIQNYIDAQYGGPGEGFYRIVGSPEEAREVIADGKLAVVPGLEFSNLFGCNLTWNPDGSETRHCTKEDIDSEIERAWDLGIRQVFPFHDVDSALGGTGLFSEFLNFVGFYGTQGFWKTSPCENGGEGDDFFYNAGFVSATGDLTGILPAELTDVVLGITEGRLPAYQPGRQCNDRTVTDLGAYAIDKIMKKGFIIDIDHAAFRSKQLMLDYTAKTVPDYPMISGHGGHGGISNAQAQQIIRQGGIIYPANQNGKGHVDFIEKLRPHWEASGTSRPLAVGYGADANGLRNLPGPRGMERVM
ncbi:MAG: hypothetical protein R3352_09980, partial [Salinisphaeraceae bacterium]|nr:hypothetical protein [Salinisphaeraceae bacterium]